MMMFISFFPYTAIQQEKSQVELIDGIEGFNRHSLKHTETVEKNPLPTKETIDQVMRLIFNTIVKCDFNEISFCCNL